MVRRRLTIKRLDPWSVLKFGAVLNLVFLAIFLLVMGVVWFIVDRLALVDQVCSMAIEFGFTTCGVNAGNLFRALILLGLLWVVVQTAVLVFLAFIHNLIADLTGGLTITVIEEGAVARQQPMRRVTTASTPPPASRSTLSEADHPADRRATPPRQDQPLSNPTPSRTRVADSDADDLFRGR